MMGDRLVQWNAVAQGIDGEIKKNPTQSWGETSSSRTTGLRAVAAWTQGHRHRTTLSSAPTAGVCCLALPKPNICVTRGNKDLTSPHAPGPPFVSQVPPERLRVSQR